MKIKHHEIEIQSEKPFDNCKLAREPYARVLTDIVDTYADGFVLAINNEWGTGKTTFVKMWQQHLKNEGFRTVYFNAWENDFDNAPLVAIMSELATLTNIGNDKVFKSVIEKGSILVKNIAPVLVKSLVKKYIGDINLDTIENTTKASTEILEQEIKAYTSKKKTVVDFRNELEKFVKLSPKEKPLIFIVDELDRCRPNYAVEVLEQIKHFFSVSGIVFVLSIDKNHLSSAIKGFYGSEQINTDEYLRRFIDLEYSIPSPSNKDFCKYLYSYFSFEEFFLSSDRKQFPEFKDDSHLLLKMADLLFQKTNCTLRQQEKIFGQTRLILKMFNPNEFIFPHILFVLIYLKTINNELYKKIENNSFTLQELSNVFSELMPANVKDLYDINLVYIQALLLHFYNNTQEHKNRTKLFETDNQGTFTTPITSLLDNITGNSKLVNCFKNIDDTYNYSETSLTYLLKKINLIDPIAIK